MNKKASEAQIASLLEKIRALPDQPRGEHLSDDEFIDYCRNKLNSGDEQRVHDHLASCSFCLDEIQRLVQAFDNWQTEKGKQRLDAMTERLIGLWIVQQEQGASEGSSPVSLTKTLEEIGRSLFGAFKQPLSWMASSTEDDFRILWEHESHNPYICCKACLLKNGDLIFWISSTEFELKGKRVTIRLGPLQREATLERVSESEVGARIVIARYERDDEITIRSHDDVFVDIQ